MDCLHSMAPTDEECLKYILDDEPLPQQAEEHLKHCPICQGRLARFRHTEEYLMAKLYRSECPSTTQLNLYTAGMLTTQEVEHIAGHIEYCPLCYNEVKDTQRILAEFDPFPIFSLKDSIIE